MSSHGIDDVYDVAPMQEGLLVHSLCYPGTLTLGVTSASSDVVFGVAVSGRASAPSELGAVVGLVSNVVPRRVRVDPAMPVAQWLKCTPTSNGHSGSRSLSTRCSRTGRSSGSPSFCARHPPQSPRCRRLRCARGFVN